MYIKSIVLDGFKSYGQRTEITGFDPMFNAITGLNGTGKSNILDSICFVLGISNLTHVRANTMQDLIFKSGQAGINRAVVSIIFDNSNPAQSPPGFENVSEITVGRQIALGGKNKYFINGVSVTGKKIQDLFCSVQLNVNNPHFLIMQGRITKVLNMKPSEILSMVDEAAGTRMYEVRKQDTQKLIEKKDSKLAEFQAVIKEELTPKLKKLREEREQFLEYQRTERDLIHLMGLFQAWQYFEAKRNFMRSDEALKEGQQKIAALEEKIDANKAAAKEITAQVELITANNNSDASKELQEVEAKLKEKEKEEAKILASAKSIEDDISTENKKFKQLERTLSNDEKALREKENELSKVQSLFESLKENERVDSEALDLAQKKYEALCAGMELNEDGETETLAEQLMNAKEEASRANTESKQAAMQLTFCENQLKAKSKNVVGTSSDYQKDEANLKKYEQNVSQIENSIKQLNFSETEMSDLNNRYRVLNQEIRILGDEIDEFESRRPYTSFRYRDPEPNFNKASVKGVVCKLFSMKDDIYASALETAASGKLYNVVVDTDMTSKKLLQRGDLQTRTTFIPLNKISGYKIKDNIVKYAQDLVGKENCQPALSLITYDRSVEAAMEYVFGDVFICKNIDIAKRVTFDQRILKRCVTLDGDSTDPRGILSGGATQKGESVLKLLKRIQQLESELNPKQGEIKRIVTKIEQLRGVQEQYNALKHKHVLTKHELDLIRDRLRNTSFARLQDEVDGLKTQIVELKAKIAKCQENENKFIAKVKDLETKMKDSSGYKERRLKEAEREMEQYKIKAEKSGKEWRKREQDYANLTLEIKELKKALEETREQLKITEENIKKMEDEYQRATAGSDEVKETVKQLQAEAKQIKETINKKNKEVQSKLKRKDQLLAQNIELELEIKKFSHEINALTAACKASKHREQEYLQKIDKKNAYMKQGEELSSQEGQDLERRIKVAQEKKHKLGRLINAEAQTMFEVEDKRFQDMVRKQGIVRIDREKLVAMMSELDEKKENALKLAMDQVSKDFGSIFATLLPGANAKLVPVQGTNKYLQGLEIKVSLGNVWKENLTELSGGQRSLAALSLILAMLLFKPAPLYILDEVDAALDLSHTQNIGRMLRSHFKKSQFIVVSLKDGMFNNANVLFRTKFIDGVSAVQRTENNHH